MACGSLSSGKLTRSFSIHWRLKMFTIQTMTTKETSTKPPHQASGCIQADQSMRARTVSGLWPMAPSRPS